MSVNFYPKSRLFMSIMFLYQVVQANIDTREGQAQQHQAYVYDTIQTLTNNSLFYGNVGFDQGVVFVPPAVNPFICQVTLGIHPPIESTIRLADSASHLGTYSINIVHDLTLNCTQFDMGPNFGGQGTFVINYPYQVFLTRNMSIPGNFGTLDFNSNTGGVLNGLGNSFSLDNTGFLDFEANFPGGLTVKNLNIIGIPGFVAKFSPTSPVDAMLTLENVQLTMFPGREVFFYQVNVLYTGQNNIIGDGGYIQFSSYLGGVSRFVTLASQTNVHVLPNTTLALAAFDSSAFSFNFTDNTSQLLLDNCTLQIGSNVVWNPLTGAITHLVFTKGTVIINGTVTLHAEVPGSTLQLGDGIDPTNNCNLIFLPASKLIIDNGMTFSYMNV